MRAIDTNVVLRVILDDDAEQVAIALRLLRTPTLVTSGVLMETAWTLRSVYGLPRDIIAGALTALLDTPTVNVADDALVRWAIERYRDHGADLADMLHLVAARGASSFASFEKRLARQAGDDAPVTVERLA